MVLSDNAAPLNAFRINLVTSFNRGEMGGVREIAKLTPLHGSRSEYLAHDRTFTCHS